jgi:ubiquinone/menaquinone biosynthesis C-methylase UbiE
MRRAILFFALMITLQGIAQSKKQPFCGVAYSKLHLLKDQLKEQFDFLKVQEQDTVVDIGAASGWFEGAFAAGSGVSSVHFVLVDIDTGCMNRKRVDAMVQHYSAVKGAPINYSFELVHNTPENLGLPLNTYKKVWVFNMLHEINDKDKLIKDIFSVLQPGGEVVLLEIIPKKPGQLHGGCNKPLMEPKECRKLFESNGFQQQEAITTTKQRKHITFSMMRFTKP